MKRRQFLSGAAVAGATAAAASTFAKPAIAQDVREWRLITTWPKNFPGLGTGANLLAEYITKASEGRLKVTVFGAGEIVPAFEAIDAVGSGTVEMGHGAPYYWKGKVDATQYIAAMPFGLNAQEQNAWFQWGGGQELADKVYAELNCKFFPSGNTGTQMGGWFNKEMNTIDDYKGLKMRIPGLGGEVVKAAGANVVNLPGGEIPPALQSGAIDATEWVGPYNDLAFGLYKSAKYYYYPGWHEPATVLDNFINLDAWNALPDDLKAIVEQANRAVNQMVLSEFTARNVQALDTLRNKHGVDVRPFSDDILTNLGKLSGEVLRDLVASNPLSQEVFESLIAFRTQSIAWSKFSESAFAQARILPFKY
ncbi:MULTISPECIES: TRAP transporter substrate-binding protein [Thalassospira]|jgi:TRAP-type mannitol/chloroaromatic compound transport system substrate-binding protein|uniref:ABC transporter substrate-binding protein n=1 Tax=Thalassospira profundimaris TaxID=502049 RepID=A0A367V659_9PROT|nr:MULTISPECIES: TRAP transporter substrate-binding protein [Thalassospira]MBR9900050.1 TRAP transporter substrate-binding protein [Rhodospirillales bacterium]KZB72843.1 ABC transporter substrate-binding protein [Thalassospira sp. MCCC 1A01148]MBO6807149.1 TRAP transporter substrate-binding protein [Thalassospira sp.]MBO6841797.1 TRAP transporter substrate-binding protein [Thalassospira sp.]RCK20529.1 ABC transporter substrate-binding protein [Thalassospira profundimaris]